jgi:putative membrane protein
MMWWNHGFWGSGWGWSLFVIFVVAMFACIVMMGRMMMRRGTSGPMREGPSRPSWWGAGDRDAESPEQILDRRLASGEIDVEEFNRLRDALRPASTSGADTADRTGAGPPAPRA